MSRESEISALLASLDSVDRGILLYAAAQASEDDSVRYLLGDIFSLGYNAGIRHVHGQTEYVNPFWSETINLVLREA